MNRSFRGLSIALLLFACAPALGQSVAGTPISALPSATTPLSGSEYVPIVQGGVTRKVTSGQILPNSGVTAGVYGDATHCNYLTIAADGRVTSATSSTSCPGGGGGGTPANPTATIGATAVNGVATTYMRSDAAPPLPATLPALNASNLTNLNASAIASGTVPAANLPLATTGVFGAVKPDGTTVTISAGIISAAAPSGCTFANPTATIGATAVNGVATTCARSDSAPALPATLPAVSGVNITALNASNLGSGTVPAARGGAGAVNGLLKANGSGVVSQAVSATDFAPATTGSSILKGSSGGFANAASGTDYAPATSGASLLYGNGSGGFSNATVGNGLIFTGGVLNPTLKVGNGGAAITATTYPINCTNDGGSELLFTGSSASAWSLAAPSGSCGYGTGFAVVNRGSTNITLTATGNINGTATKVFTPGQSGFVFADPTSTTWYSEDGAGTGGGTGGGGTFNYSSGSNTITASTYFAPIGGGGVPVTTEAAVQVNSPAATTVANLKVTLSVDPGNTNTVVVTTRLAGSDQTLTCTITGNGTTNKTCSDTTHSFNPAAGDLLDWKIVNSASFTGTINISASNGTSNVGVTSVACGTGLSGGTFTTTGACSLNLGNNNTWTAAQRSSITTLTPTSNTYTPSFNASNNFTLTLAATNTIANPSTTPVAGQSGMIEIIQDGTGSRTVTWGSQYVAATSVGTLTLSTAANAKDYLGYYVVDATHIVVSVGALNAAH